MERRKVLYILILILALPALSTTTAAAAASPIQNFANNLLLVVPPVLFILSLIALRKADYEYAFTLLLAAIIVTVALSAFQGNIQSYTFFTYSLTVTVNGPTNGYVNNNLQYSVAYVSSLPTGWTINSKEYQWLVYYNFSILVYNSSSGYINTNYVTSLSSSQNSLSFTPTQSGVYSATYSVIYFASANTYPAIASGSGGVITTVSKPSPFSWLSQAFLSTIESFLTIVAGSLVSIFNIFGQYLFGVISYAFTLPLPFGPISQIYNTILNVSVSLSLLFLGGTVAYNAIQGYYEDLIDVASDLFYKIGVWLFFTFGGLEIYTYIADFINSLINEIIAPYLPSLTLELSSTAGTYAALYIVGDVFPFFLGAIKTALGDILFAFLFLAALVIIRYLLILAIVALIPLLATLWLFEWTRGIANALIDVLVGLIFAGLLNTIVLTLFIATGAAYLFMLIPIIADLDTILSIVLMAFTIRPHEVSRMKTRRVSTSSPTQTSTPQAPIIKEEKKVEEEKVYYM
ncbi:hypothetical protein [Saccharolobus shibatae]|uniref:TrbL/VirB6 plasmid conjugal transfer protein n=1 Tax=Saccharolobus shibatae TaxID=2286 RepID=A0A8F5BS51_9CREN|nr:hypothetical protein [Saccharolobus shibatae]QXJ30345.1 TrbL/VirB6 plasmid conjugal transfer protein [Saccharolobus shibatae]QXJ30447.1 TrbL/VirB6 plasmid conjugal transfer protein [Saccharolobus shibatae]